MYVLNTGFYKSIDGGRTYSTINTPHGDNHDLWIAPDDPNRMIEANDGGRECELQRRAHVVRARSSDSAVLSRRARQRFPYHVYGAATGQLYGAHRVAHNRLRHYGKGLGRNGGQRIGLGAAFAKRFDDCVRGNYGGLLERLDHHTGQSRDINVWPDNPMGWGAEGMKYRFQWNFPILFSPNDPNVLYTAGSHLFKSTNEGQTWQIISGDLTRNDKAKQGSSGGPITKDNTSVEYYCTIFTIAESPVTKGVMWTGSDDGLVHVTRDSHAAKPTWENVHQEHLRPARMDSDQLHRALATRRLHRPTSPRRCIKRTTSAPIFTRPAIYRQDVEEDHQRHPRQRLHARHSRRPESARPVVRWHRNGQSTVHSTTATLGSHCN
jgi:hypothetical protein